MLYLIGQFSYNRQRDLTDDIQPMTSVGYGCYQIKKRYLVNLADSDQGALKSTKIPHC